MRAMARPPASLVLTLLLAVWACAPRGAGVAPEPPALMAGAAVRDITPDLQHAGQPVYMGGLERGQAATGIHDPLFARALVMTDASGHSVGLVMLDLIGFFHDDVLRVREELARRHPEVALDYLAVASTHTHAGPDVIGLWLPIGSSVDAAYVERVRSAAVDAVAEAFGRRRPARLYVGTTTAPGLAQDTRLPTLTDDTLLVMGLKEADGDAGIASLVNWNSHPSVSGGDNTLISADFPHTLLARVEREWGGVGLYASGDLGGQIGSGRVKMTDPVTGERPKDRVKRAALIGDRIGELAMQALDAAVATGPAPAPTLRVRSKSLMLPMDNERFEKGLAIGLIRERRLHPDPERAGRFLLESEAAVVDVGPARWALVPGELYPELALGGIQDPQDPAADYPGAPREAPLRAMSGEPLFIICLANDELGYIIPKSEWDSAPPWAYGRDEPQYGEKNSLGPETAPILMGVFQDLLR